MLQVLNKQSYAIVGLGSSGLSAALYLLQLGKKVVVTDANPNPVLAKQLPESTPCYFGSIQTQVLTSVDCVVLSPGVDPRIEAVMAAKTAQIPVINDVQLFIEALRQRDKTTGVTTPIVAITGSNAKSTVTTLVGEMAKVSGVAVGVGGNIGTPALQLLDLPKLDLVVLELSSFQLEHITNLSASVATILNLSADHLDRHLDMDDYLTQKLNIFESARSAVVCTDDESLMYSCLNKLTQINKNMDIFYVGSKQKSSNLPMFHLQERDGVVTLVFNNQALIDANQLKIKGKHNILNALSSLALGYAVGMPIPKMLQALRDFKGLPHRCEYVDCIAGKDYFNDSKGTNIGSTLAAIDGLGAVYGECSLAVILGGQGKGQDFTQLSDDILKWADSIYLIGVDAHNIKQGLLKKQPLLQEKIHYAETLDNAVSLASRSTAKAVLLSPACASLDQFKNYAERGEYFVRLVRAL